MDSSSHSASEIQIPLRKFDDVATSFVEILEETDDYIIKDTGIYGAGIFANRNMRKGEVVFQKGTCDFLVPKQNKLMLRLIRKVSDDSTVESHSTVDDKQAIKEWLSNVVDYGVPDDDSNHWCMENPACMMNHSCCPTTGMDGITPSEEAPTVALRDISKGEELTCSYFNYFYDEGSFWEDCMCGADNCVGGCTSWFAGLPENKQVEVLLEGTQVSDYVKSCYQRELLQKAAKP